MVSDLILAGIRVTSTGGYRSSGAGVHIGRGSSSGKSTSSCSGYFYDGGGDISRNKPPFNGYGRGYGLGADGDHGTWTTGRRIPVVLVYHFQQE